MKRPPLFVATVTGLGIAFSAADTHAGIGSLFSKRSCNNCEASEQDPPKKKSKGGLFDLPEPPRAGTASAVPAVMTNQRAQRQEAPAPAAAPAAAAADGCAPGASPAADSRVDLLQRDVMVLKEQIRILSTLLQQSHAVPAPVPAPAPATAPPPAPPAQSH